MLWAFAALQSALQTHTSFNTPPSPSQEFPLTRNQVCGGGGVILIETSTVSDPRHTCFSGIYSQFWPPKPGKQKPHGWSLGLPTHGATAPHPGCLSYPPFILYTEPCTEEDILSRWRGGERGCTSVSDPLVLISPVKSGSPVPSAPHPAKCPRESAIGPLFIHPLRALGF